MNEYDLVSRRLAKLAGLAVLSWLLPGFALHLRFLRWLDARHIPFPGHPDRTSDTIAELEGLQGISPLWALILEFQREPDPLMFGRLLIYLGTFWLSERPDELRGSRYQLAAAVVNLTGTSGSMPASRTMTLPGADGATVVLHVKERWLQDEPAEPLLVAIRSGLYSPWLLVLLPLHQTDNPTETIRQWLELFEAEPAANLRSEWHGLTSVMAELSPHADLWANVLRGLNVTKSAFLESIRKEGRDEGRKAGQAELIVQLLQMKFPGQVTAEQQQRIERQDDTNRLRAWFAAAYTATSLEEFERRCASDNGH